MRRHVLAFDVHVCAHNTSSSFNVMINIEQKRHSRDSMCKCQLETGCQEKDILSGA